MPLSFSIFACCSDIFVDVWSSDVVQRVGYRETDAGMNSSTMVVLVIDCLVVNLMQDSSRKGREKREEEGRSTAWLVVAGCSGDRATSTSHYQIRQYTTVAINFIHTSYHSPHLL